MTTPPPEQQPGYQPGGQPQQPYQGQPYPGQAGATAFATPPPQKKRRVWLWVLIGVLALFLILLVSCVAIVGTAVKSAAPADTSTTDAGSASSDEPSSPASKKAAAPAAAGIGDTVKTGDWQFKVTDFDCGHSRVGSSDFGQKAQGQFCFLKITAKNNGDSEGTLTDSNQKLSDDDGKTYSSDSGAALYEDPDDVLFLKGVNPGNTAKGLIVFDVPKKAKITEVSLAGGLFGGAAKVSLK